MTGGWHHIGISTLLLCDAAFYAGSCDNAAVLLMMQSTSTGNSPADRHSIEHCCLAHAWQHHDPPLHEHVLCIAGQLIMQSGFLSHAVTRLWVGSAIHAPLLLLLLVTVTSQAACLSCQHSWHTIVRCVACWDTGGSTACVSGVLAFQNAVVSCMHFSVLVTQDCHKSGAHFSCTATCIALTTFQVSHLVATSFLLHC